MISSNAIQQEQNKEIEYENKFFSTIDTSAELKQTILLFSLHLTLLSYLTLILLDCPLGGAKQPTA